MKPQYFVKTIVVFALALYMLTGCKRYDQDLTWRINTGIYSSPLMVRFLNANPDATNQPKNFTVTISGKDANKVVLGSGGTNFKTANGMLPLALNGVSPTPQNPVIFSVYADIPGFAPVSQSFIITDTTPQVRSVFAVEYANPTNGTAAFIQQTRLNAGVSPAVTLSTQTNAGMGEISSIAIQEGTQMLDVNGNAVSGDQLKTKVVHFGTGTTSSLASFPGGLTAPDAIGKDGQPIPGGVTFVTGGLLSIKMFAGSTEVKKFSKPLNVTMEMKNDVVNPGTNQAVAVGDTIPVWSLNEETGQWKYESMGTVAMDGNGKLAVQFQAAHLSCWNLDWWWSCFGSYPTCNNPLTVIIHTDPTYCSGNYEVTLTTERGQYLGALHGTELYNGFTCVFINTPVIEKAKIVITDNSTGRVVGQSILFTPCSQGTIEVTLGKPTPPDLVKINITVEGKCTNRNAAFNINGWFSFYLAGAGPLGDKTLIYVNNGQATVSLLNGATYTIEACYDNEDHIGNGKLQKAAFVFLPVADEKYALSGTGVFDPGTNTLNISFILETNCH